jgi:hypothetical protein
MQVSAFPNLCLLGYALLWGGVSSLSAQPSDPNKNPMLEYDPNKVSAFQGKLFQSGDVNIKMAPFDKKTALKTNQSFTRESPIKMETNLTNAGKDQQKPVHAWSGVGGEAPKLSNLGGDSKLGKIPKLFQENDQDLKMASGFDKPETTPKVYLGPENPASHSERELIQKTLGGIDSQDQLQNHQLSQSEIRRLLMTPERVRRAQALGDKDPGIVTDVAPRAQPVR